MSNETEENLQFTKAISLFDEGDYQNGADILFELAQGGHLDSIEQLSYLFLDQENFDVVESLLQAFPDPKNPTILYLRARLLECRSGFDPLAFQEAANAGSSSAAISLFDFYLLTDPTLAKVWLDTAQKGDHPKYQQCVNLFYAQVHGTLSQEINNIDLWPDTIEEIFNEELLQHLRIRAGELNATTIQELIDTEMISVEFAVHLITNLVDYIENKEHALELLQVGISTWRQWEETSFDGFHIDYLDLMEKVIQIVDQLEISEKDLSQIFANLIRNDSMWRDPVILASFLMLKPLSFIDLDNLANKFISIWDFQSNILSSNNDIDIFEDDLWDLSPLLALVAVKKSLAREKLNKILQIVSFPSNEQLALAFWEYFCACLAKGDPNSYWAPHTIWRDGFFENTNFKKFDLDESSVTQCLLFFWDHIEVFKVSNVFGEETIRAQVLKLATSHQQIDAKTRGEIQKFILSLPLDE